ncbi:hypothetical protein ATCC90586_007790 [Pythium insidiosum]|nr:hypothetical protein ATCC90586_007790 [Pythium insidiosum]
MNGLVAAPRSPPPARWLRPAECLVYLVPVGAISTELFDSYVALLQRHRVLPLSSLSRPGGYAPELSPFRGFSWDGPGALRFRFVATTDRIDAVDGEDVHACHRPLGVLGLCHCPSTPSLRAAYDQFMASIRRFPGMVLTKCFAFEHAFDDARSVDECAALSHLVMFPKHHELDEGCSTVSLHLQVVLDTLGVTLLMTLESTIRAAMRQHAGAAPGAAPAPGDDSVAGLLLDTNVDPERRALPAAGSLSWLARDAPPSPSPSPSAARASSLPSSLGGGVGSAAAAVANAASAAASGVTSLFGADARSHSRKRQLARQRKLFGDYAVLVGCVADAMEHYFSALELLREEERKSGGAPGDALWLAAALEGYVFCLVQQSKDRFVVEIVEKTSEALALYAKAGAAELESLLVEHVGWYYVAVAAQLSAARGAPDKLEELVWVKRLLGDALERGLVLAPELPWRRHLEFLVQAARMLEAVGHHRRMALFLHEAACLVAAQHQHGASTQRTKDLRAALRLEQLTARRLGIREPTGQRWLVALGQRRRPGARRSLRRISLEETARETEPWLVLRVHVLRQLVVLARLLGEPQLVGRYCLALLEALAWCDSIAEDDGDDDDAEEAQDRVAVELLDQPQTPCLAAAVGAAGSERRSALHAKSGVYASPPASVETKSKRYFSLANSPSAAAASLTSTIANTPRTLLATPRQLTTAAVHALSTKTPFSSAPTTPSGGDGSAVDGTGSGLGSGSGSGSAPGGGDDALGDVWNLRRRGLVRRLERRVLALLETECLVLRPQEQVELRSFVAVERLRVLRRRVDAASAWAAPATHPILSEATALQRCGRRVAENGSGGGESEAPAFFYNPFEAKKKKRKSGEKTTSSGEHAGRRGERRADEDSDDDGDDAAEEREHERVFPSHERIQLSVLLSNPLGVEIDVQQVTAWAVGRPDEPDADEPGDAVAAVVETYPSAVLLAPYERRKRVVLSLSPLLPRGVVEVRGCLLKALNVRMSCRLPEPLVLRVVEPLPRLSLAVREIGSLLEGASAGAGVAADGRVCMFATERKRCVLQLRNTGSRAVDRLHVAVGLRPRGRRGAPTTPPLSVLSALEPGERECEADEGPRRLATDRVALEASTRLTLPLLPGDHADVEFEVALARAPPAEYEHDEQLEWTVVYGSACSRSLLREARHALTLVSLPSLAIVSAQVLPSYCEGVAAAARVADNTHCLLVLDVANPTETLFLVGWRRDAADVEIGRQSTRRLVLELPRLATAAEPVREVSADVLAARLRELVGALHWRTYFGTTGHLTLDARLWPAPADVARQAQQLWPAPLLFTLHAAAGLDEREPERSEPADEGAFPLRFFTPAHPRGRPHVFQAQLLRRCEVVVQVQRSAEAAEPASARVQVLVLRDGAVHRHNERGQRERREKDEQPVAEQDDDDDDDDGDDAPPRDDAVLVSGLLDRTVDWRSGERVEEWTLQCVFLSHGRFHVSARGRMGGTTVWSHLPLVIDPTTMRRDGPECFRVRRLLWDDIQQLVQPSEAEELRRVLGNQRLDENEELRRELSTLVEILSEFQQQTDGVREELLERHATARPSQRAPPVPEPAGRELLLGKLKLLALDLRDRQRPCLPTSKDEALLHYVLSASTDGRDGESEKAPAVPSTPRMAELGVKASQEEVILRPGTSCGRRPSTAPRPVSRGSTVSLSTTSSSLLESPELRQRLNVQEIDSIQEDVLDALLEEKQQLLEDIEFIQVSVSASVWWARRDARTDEALGPQSCIDMEQELLDDDRRAVAAAASSARPPPTPAPTLQELRDFHRTLEQTIEAQGRETADPPGGSSPVRELYLQAREQTPSD